ncbi:MAG: alpha/beta hydrolase [Proteobacteria bacterium]|nr:alpha/beta hydrolase [Pseudomonadota bacterium]
MKPDDAFAHDFVEANGLRFHVASCGPGDGDRLALCLHGFPECWYSWRHQMPLLAELGYRVWAPDLRGYGESSRPEGVRHYAVEALMEDVAGLIDASGAKRTLLLGHDWGAIIAWLFAIRKLRALDGLVIMNVPHPACYLREWKRPDQFLRSWYAYLFQLPRLPEALLAGGVKPGERIGRMLQQSAVHKERFGPEVQRIYVENAARPGAMTAMLHYYRAFAWGGGLARQRDLGFPVIETPTLMIWGERDQALSIKTTRGTEAYVRDFTLRTVPTASHWVQQDEPEVVNDMLRAWLAVPDL